MSHRLIASSLIAPNASFQTDEPISNIPDTAKSIAVERKDIGSPLELPEMVIQRSDEEQTLASELYDVTPSASMDDRLSIVEKRFSGQWDVPRVHEAKS